MRALRRGRAGGGLRVAAVPQQPASRRHELTDSLKHSAE